MTVSVPSLLFADDAKLFSRVKTLDDSKHLQKSVDKLVQWSKIWRLDLNASKCKVLTITLKKKPKKFNYHVDNCLLDHVSHIKDLGIIFDSKLTFVHHIDSIVGKANRIIGLIKRNFNLII